jgi:hypothetical protein
MRWNKLDVVTNGNGTYSLYAYTNWSEDRAVISENVDAVTIDGVDVDISDGLTFDLTGHRCDLNITKTRRLEEAAGDGRDTPRVADITLNDYDQPGPIEETLNIA